MVFLIKISFSQSVRYLVSKFQIITNSIADCVLSFAGQRRCNCVAATFPESIERRGSADSFITRTALHFRLQCALAAFNVVNSCGGGWRKFLPLRSSVCATRIFVRRPGCIAVQRDFTQHCTICTLSFDHRLPVSVLYFS